MKADMKNINELNEEIINKHIANVDSNNEEVEKLSRIRTETIPK